MLRHTRAAVSADGGATWAVLSGGPGAERLPAGWYQNGRGPQPRGAAGRRKGRRIRAIGRSSCCRRYDVTRSGVVDASSDAWFKVPPRILCRRHQVCREVDVCGRFGCGGVTTAAWVRATASAADVTTASDGETGGGGSYEPGIAPGENAGCGGGLGSGASPERRDVAAPWGAPVTGLPGTAVVAAPWVAPARSKPGEARNGEGAAV